MAHYLIIGLGQIGQSVANQLAQQGQTVTGISRSPKPDLRPTVTHIQADARAITATDLGRDAATISHIAIIVSPDASSEQGYHDSYFAISQNVVKLRQALPNLQRVVFISSTGVYGQNNGEFIDIATPVQLPTAKTAQILLATEQLLQERFGEQCTLIRPSGIYGHTRLRLLKMATQLANDNSDVAAPSNTWTNRIFDTDLVIVIANVLTESTPLPLYLATDTAPVPLYDVLAYLAAQQGLTPHLPDRPATGGKRIISNLPRHWLQYPNWQTGYQAILSNAVNVANPSNSANNLPIRR